MTDTLKIPLFCLPLMRVGSRYVPDPAWGGPLPPHDALSRYFKEAYATRDATVEIDGVSYSTRVLEPVSSNDVAYVLVDRNRKPSVGSNVAIETKAYADHLRSLASQLLHAETARPGQGLYLPTDFVPPKLSLLGKGESTHGTITFAHLRLQARALILGSPGVGKTTCLRMLGYSEARDGLARGNSRLPLYVAARDLAAGTEFHDAVVTRLTASGSRGVEFETVAKTGQLLVLLDGLDEVPAEDRNRVVGSARRFAVDHPTVGMIVTTRPYVDLAEWDDFQRFEIQPFDRDQTEEWIRRQFSHAAGTSSPARQVRSLLTDKTVVDLARIPLFLMFVSAIGKSSAVPPSTRAGVVFQYLRFILSDWDEIRGIRRHPHSDRTSWETSIRTLCRTAFRCQLENRPEFSRSVFLSWHGESTDAESSEQTLSPLAAEGGVCVRREDAGSWMFSSQSMQDVLAAFHAVAQVDADLRDYLARDLAATSGRFLPYMCEMAQDASPLVDIILSADLKSSTKGALLAEIVVQDVSLDRGVYSRACRAVQDAFREVTDDLATVESEPTRDGTRVRLLWKRPKSLQIPLVSGRSLVSVLLGYGVASRKRQLATYLDASHSRLSHSVGALLMASGLIRNIQESEAETTVDVAMEDDLPKSSEGDTTK